ncbi:hypothetical protein ACMFMG_011131 [Clarireedia jacksonii]
MQRFNLGSLKRTQINFGTWDVFGQCFVASFPETIEIYIRTRSTEKPSISIPFIQLFFHADKCTLIVEGKLSQSTRAFHWFLLHCPVFTSRKDKSLSQGLRTPPAFSRIIILFFPDDNYVHAGDIAQLTRTSHQCDHDHQQHALVAS